MARYIDADKLIISLRKCAKDEHSHRASTTWTDACEAFIDEIEDLLVDDKDDVAPVAHAHWVGLNGTFVPLDKFGKPKGIAFCSHCKEFLTGSDEYKMTKGWYCPSCGARMDEEEPNV